MTDSWRASIGVLSLLAVATLLSGCPARQPVRRPDPPVEVASAGPVATHEAPISTAANTSSPGGFAASPLTPLAISLRDLVIAAVSERPLPTDVPLEPIRDSGQLVRAKGGRLPRVSELEFVAFGFELDMLLFEPGRAPRDGEDDGVRSVAFLSRTGAKAAHVIPARVVRPAPLPRWLGGVADYGRELHASMRAGRTSSLLLGEAERSVIGNDEVFRELLAKNQSDRLDEAEALAKQSDGPRGYRLDDAALLARDRSGTLWAFTLNFDDRDGVLVLDTRPLVRVERLDLEPRSPDSTDRPDVPPAPPF